MQYTNEYEIDILNLFDEDYLNEWKEYNEEKQKIEYLDLFIP